MWEFFDVPVSGVPDAPAFINPYNLKVYAREDQSGGNASGINLYLENNGTQSLSNFSARYFFSKAEDPSKSISILDTYTPDSSPALGGSGTELYINLDFAGKTLAPGTETSYGK